jgi:hypothetical protein
MMITLETIANAANNFAVTYAMSMWGYTHPDAIEADLEVLEDAILAYRKTRREPTETQREREGMDETDVMTCWCGEHGTYAELFNDDHLDSLCGGSGKVECRCGGDVCVCHHHSQASCLGCEDCEIEDPDHSDL